MGKGMASSWEDFIKIPKHIAAELKASIANLH